MKRKKPITAIELHNKLKQNKNYINNIEKIAKKREEAIHNYAKNVVYVLEDLEKIGVIVDTISDICKLNQSYYKKAVPILLKWLKKIEDEDIKEEIVRTLSMPWAKPIAAKPFIEEFIDAPNEALSSLKWAIGNGLSIVADDSVFEEIVNLVKNKKHGKSREMLAVALGNMSTPQAISVLIDLLKDEEVAGHAIMGLRKLNAIKARPFLDSFLNHPKLWIRNQAKKTITKFDKIESKQHGSLR